MQANANCLKFIYFLIDFDSMSMIKINKDKFILSTMKYKAEKKLPLYIIKGGPHLLGAQFSW